MRLATGSIHAFLVSVVLQYVGPRREQLKRNIVDPLLSASAPNERSPKRLAAHLMLLSRLDGVPISYLPPLRTSAPTAEACRSRSWWQQRSATSTAAG